ncbi:unnamed protein product [Nippostrongylus brasiliensis]|uniref:Uncharacterized protein n=1 Tax=Nippostrongylus brasiliensis TaxID=27835 RepID=A0A0N4XIT9_NIPBR|nr:unnamed protein product [Nippostrongylus brasiliensis]
MRAETVRGRNDLASDLYIPDEATTSILVQRVVMQCSVLKGLADSTTSSLRVEFPVISALEQNTLGRAFSSKRCRVLYSQHTALHDGTALDENARRRVVEYASPLSVVSEQLSRWTRMLVVACFAQLHL